MNDRGRWMGTGALALALLAGTAAAQQNQNQQDWDSKQKWESKHDGKHEGKHAEYGQQHFGQVQTVQPLRHADFAFLQKETDDNKTVTLMLQNGQVVSAEMDGKNIGPECLHVQGNTIKITDENKNKTIAQFQLPGNLQQQISFQSQGQFRGETRFGTNEPRMSEWEWQQRQREMYGDRWQTQDRWRTEQRYSDRTTYYPSDQDRFRYESRQTDRTYYPSDQDRYRYESRYTDRTYYPSDQDRFRYESRTTTDRTYYPERDRMYYQERTTQYPSYYERSYPSDQDRFRYERRTMGTTEFSTQRPVLGVMMVEAEQSDLRQAGASGQFSQGILIEQVNDNLPADQAGLRSGDVIVAIDGQQPATVDRLRSTLSNKEFGDTVRLTVLRNGQQRNINVNLFRPTTSTYGTFQNRTFNTGETEWRYRMPQQIPPYPTAPDVESRGYYERNYNTRDRWFDRDND